MLATEDVTKKGLILPRRQIAASLFGMASRHSCIYPRTLSENTTKPSLKRASDRCCSTLALLSKHKFVRSACLRVKRIIHSACRLKIPSRTEKRTRTVLRDFRFCRISVGFLVISILRINLKLSIIFPLWNKTVDFKMFRSKTSKSIRRSSVVWQNPWCAEGYELL